MLMTVSVMNGSRSICCLCPRLTKKDDAITRYPRPHPCSCHLVVVMCNTHNNIIDVVGESNMMIRMRTMTMAAMLIIVVAMMVMTMVLLL